MKFINRTAELKKLLSCGDRSEGSFIVLWGRRRIGKTRLLLEWKEKTGGFYWVADESRSEIQRRFLAEQLNSIFPDFSAVEYPTWKSLLERLSTEAKSRGKRGPFIFDEFPYLVAGDASVSSVFQNWIDGPAKKANLIVAIAGSSQRMMHAIVLSKSAPLYGRAQSILKIEALGFEHLHFLNHPSATDCVKFYSAFGGIPRYWELAQGVGTNVEGKIDELILDPMGVLHMEGKQLLLEEYKNSQLLKSVLEAIGSGSHRPSEVAARLNMKQTSLSLAFTQLMEMDFVTREVPFGEKESSKKALYKIKDPFLRFWYKIVSPNQSFLTYASKTQRVALLKKHFPSLCALGWEAICRDQIVKMEAVVTEAGRFWRKSELEWDLVCETEDALILGECKWSENILQRDKWLKHIKAMLVKPTPFATQKKIRYMLFVPEAKSIDNDLVEIVTLAHMQNVTA